MHKGLELHLPIPTISYGPLLFFLILNIKGKILVNTTPYIPLDRHSRNLQYLPWYVVVHKDLDLHLPIPTISYMYGPLLFFLILNI